MKKNRVIKYNKCLSEEYAAYRLAVEYNKGGSVDDNINFYSAWLCSQFSEFDCGNDIAEIISGILHADLKGYGTHIFIRDRLLYDSLKNMTFRDVDGLSRYLDENGIDCSYLDCKYDEDMKCMEKKEIKRKCLFFFIHYPDTEGEGLSVRIRIGENNELCCDYLSGGHAATFSSKSKYLIHPETETDIMDQKMWQLFLNLFCYMKAFPECVSTGVPHGFRFENPSSSAKVELSTSDKMIEKIVASDGEKRIITPHFRRGHFRYLASDYFKNKKGQFVFIEETMVKGRNVKTVEQKR